MATSEARSLTEVAQAARAASLVLGAANVESKNKALACIRDQLIKDKAKVIAANVQDKTAASSNKLDSALLARLDLEGAKYDTLLSGVDSVIKVEDPVGRVSLARTLADGLDLFRVSCPIGVLCIIFESRPEAALQISSLAIKSGNAVILKGGKEAIHSNTLLVETIRAGLVKAGLPADCVQLVSTREQIKELLSLNEFIDLVIPRGSNALVKNVMANTNIPVMGHADGICHVFVDKDADPKIAVDVVVDGKTSYVAACNTTETLLIHKDALHLLPKIGEALAENGVIMHACPQSAAVLPEAMTKAATKNTFRREYLGLEISVKVVGSLEDAIVHINEHGSHHTDCIITESGATAESFMQGVSSAGVYHNASTRFADGFRYGFGAEVGVSTNRIHARGPVGLEGLLIYKYRLHGKGHCSKTYGGGEGQTPFKHVDMRQGAYAFAPSLESPPSFCARLLCASPLEPVAVLTGAVLTLALVGTCSLLSHRA